MNWLRVCAAVLSSNFFFLGSCSAVLFGASALEDRDDYGPAITETYSGPKLASVVATIPDPDKPAQRKAVLVFFSELQEFKSKNRDYSFLLPPGDGEIDNQAAEMQTKYSVSPSGPGRIIVKSSFHHDVPPAGVDVRQRYEATARDVKLLNAKYGSSYGYLILALIVASVLAVTGRILKWRLNRNEPPPSPEQIAAAKAKTTKRTLIVLAILVVLALIPVLVVLF